MRSLYVACLVATTATAACPGPSTPRRPARRPAETPRPAAHRPAEARPFDPAEVAHTVRLSRALIRLCLDQALAKDPHLVTSPGPVRAILRFVVRPNGRVNDISLAPLIDAGFQRCVAQVVSRWRFGAFQGPPKRYRVPIRLCVGPCAPKPGAGAPGGGMRPTGPRSPLASAVLAQLRMAHPQLRDCYRQALRQNPSLSKKPFRLAIRFTVLPRGAVQAVQTRPQIGSGFEACVTQVIQGFRLAPFKGRPARFRLPVTLRVH